MSAKEDALFYICINNKSTANDNNRKRPKRTENSEDPAYREFHSSLIPGADNILGVRIPQLRIMAKGLAKKEGWRTFVEAN